MVGRNIRMKERILYIGGFELPDKNAAAQRVLGISYSLVDLNYDVKLIGISKSQKEISTDNSYNGIIYESLPYPNGFINWIKYLLGLNGVLDKMKYERPKKVILYNYPSFAIWRIIRFCKKHNIKIYADVTEWYEGEGSLIKRVIKTFDVNWRMKVLHFKLDGLIVISRFLRDFYSTRINTVEIPPTFDIQDTKFQSLTIGGEISNDNIIRLVYSGSPGGGNKDRLDVIVNNVVKYSNISFTIVGITYDQYVDQFGVIENLNNIRFLGRLPHQKAINIVKKSDFTIFYRGDTLTNKAGFSTKFAESVTLGIPVITNSSSNLAEYIKKYNVGLLVEGFDVYSFAEVIEYVSKLTSEDILELKNNCKEFQPFYYKRFNDELKEFLR